MEIPEDDLNLPIGRLRKFIKDNLNGQFKIISEGSECKCPICDLNRLQEALEWYRDEAKAISMNMALMKDMAVLASINVLLLDDGKKANNVLGETNG